MGFIAGGDLTLQAKCLNLDTGLYKGKNVDFCADEITLGGTFEAEKLMRIVTDKLILSGAIIKEPELYDIQAKEVVVKGALKGSNWFKTLIQTSDIGTAFINKRNFDPFDEQSEEQILSTLLSKKFISKTVSYKYMEKTYDLQVVTNPLKKNLISSNCILSTPLVVASYQTLPNELQTHLKEVIEKHANGQNILFEFDQEREYLPSVYKNLKTDRIAQSFSDSNIWQEVKTALSSNKFISEVFAFQIGDKNYFFRILRNPENLTFKGSIDCFYKEYGFRDTKLPVGYVTNAPLLVLTNSIIPNGFKEELAKSIQDVLGDNYEFLFFENQEITKNSPTDYFKQTYTQFTIPFYQLMENVTFCNDAENKANWTQSEYLKSPNQLSPTLIDKLVSVVTGSAPNPINQKSDENSKSWWD